MIPERPTLLGIDIIREQGSNKDILDLKSRLKNGRATKAEQKKYIVMDERVYCLSLTMKLSSGYMFRVILEKMCWFNTMMTRVIWVWIKHFIQ